MAEIITDEAHEDIMEAMLNGTFEEHVDDSEENNATIENEEVTDEEDTDQEEESAVTEQPDEEIDGDLDEDSEAADDDEEEDTLVDTDSDESNDEDEEEDDTADDAEDSEDGDLDDEDQDDTENEEAADVADSGNADVVDYKAFYDAVTGTEFVVNGRKTQGFKDPNKIIQAQQMAGGFSDKMAGFKKYRPYMAPLQERGMLEDQEKFNLAMNLIDGDKEAIKQHLKNLGIDPLDIEMDTINYNGQNTLATQEQIVLEDSLETARSAGYETEIRQVIGKDWDQSSFNEYLNDGQVRADLLQHVQSGAYEHVQNRIAEFKRSDANGTFGSMSSIEQYRAAAKDIQQELALNEATRISTEARQTTANTAKADKAQEVKAEKARISKSRKETEYKAKADKQNAKVAEQRKKASSMSKKKPKAVAKATKFDPMKLEGDDFDELMNAMINGDIK